VINPANQRPPANPRKPPIPLQIKIYSKFLILSDNTEIQPETHLQDIQFKNKEHPIYISQSKSYSSLPSLTGHQFGFLRDWLIIDRFTAGN